MTRFNTALTRVENVLAAGTLAIAVFLAFLQIALRATTGVFLYWSEEAIIYLIIYSTFLGAVITLRESEHVNVDILAALLGRGGKRIMGLIASIVTIAYLLTVGVYAWLLIFEPFSFNTNTPALKLPLWTLELAVPIGFTLMFFRAIEILVRTWKHGVPDNAVEEALEAEAAAIGLHAAELHAVAETPDVTPDHDAGPAGRNDRHEQGKDLT
jgi:C4-dicarboxylate transporter DctQ subunit